MDVLFLHGGPGFNSVAEEAILGPLFARRGIGAHFWNEPAGVLAHDGTAFTHLLESAERAIVAAKEASEDGRVHVVAHSFGACLATILALPAERSPSAVLTLISPALDLDAALTNCIRVAAEDYATDAPDKEKKLRATIASGPRVLNRAMTSGLELALSDPKLLTHYWVDQNRLMQAAAALVKPEHQLNVARMFAVLAAYAEDQPLSGVRGRFVGRCNVLFGALDPIAKRREQETILSRYYADVHVTELEQASHYVHLDRVDESMDYLLSVHR